MKKLLLSTALYATCLTVMGQFEVQYEKGDNTLVATETTGKIFKDAPKEIVITDFRVEYRLFKGESLSGQSSSAATGTSYNTSANMNVWLNGLNDDGMMKTTNEIYSKFVKDLESKGYKVDVMDPGKIKSNKKFSKEKDAQVLNGTSYEKIDEKIVQSKTFIPQGVNVVSVSAPSESNTMSAAKEGQILNEVCAGQDVIRLGVTVCIDFLDFNKKGVIKKVSMEAAPILHIGGQYPSGFSSVYIAKNYKYGTYTISPHNMIFVDANDYWAEDMVETKSFEFLGSKLKNYELHANPDKYLEVSKLIADAYLTKSLSMFDSFIKSK